MIDYTGKQFGEWTALYRNGRYWHCRCSCGTEKDILTGKLTSGQTKSCGHNKLKDLTGKKFGEWTVLSYAGNMYWNCKCSCGIQKKVYSRHLITGQSKSCGHVFTGIDLTGQKFGELEVLKYAGDKYWLCKCSCGKIKTVAGYRLRNGEIKSCGHKSGFKDLTGQRFGKLTVVKYISNGFYECICDCGNKHNVYSGNLRNGTTNSCGCLKTAISKEKILDIINDYKKSFGVKPSKDEIADLLEISKSYLSKLVKDFKIDNEFQLIFKSHQEYELYNYIKGILDKNDKVLIGDRNILGKQELDLYIPSKKVAIEFNGTYWHNDLIRDKNYHINKTKACEEKGIRLIHIFEYEWDDASTKNKIKRLLENVLITNKEIIYARNCYVKHIDISTVMEFEDKYHLQGYAASKLNYGLYYNCDLVSVMTFDTPRFDRLADFEIIRYCVKNGKSIVGGAEKLFKHFIDENKPKNVISYCNVSKFTGSIYNRIGMKFDSLTEPGYVWVRGRGDNTQVLSRYQTTKAKLIENGLGKYGNTEDEIMRNLCYYKVYNCGNKKFIYNCK